MVTVSKPTRGTLHRWSGRAFLLGGGLLVVAMVIDGVDQQPAPEEERPPAPPV